MKDQISLRIIFADKKFEIGEIKSTDNIFLLKTIIKNSLLNSKEKFEPDVDKSLKNLIEDRIKLKIGFPPVTIEGKEHDTKKLNEMKISNNELIRVEVIESIGSENLISPFQDNKPMNNSIKSNENNSEANNDPIDYSKYSVKRKIIPADNSCLFNAVNYALNQNLNEPEIMRSLIAAEIQSNMDFYNSAILDGKDPYDYCDWIMKDTTWGGGIEISILSKCFQITIGVVDAVHNTIEFLGEVIILK
jgi:ubiquitin thioesterase OTU1